MLDIFDCSIWYNQKLINLNNIINYKYSNKMLLMLKNLQTQVQIVLKIIFLVLRVQRVQLVQ